LFSLEHTSNSFLHAKFDHLRHHLSRDGIYTVTWNRRSGNACPKAVYSHRPSPRRWLALTAVPEGIYLRSAN